MKLLLSVSKSVAKEDRRRMKKTLLRDTIQFIDADYAMALRAVVLESDDESVEVKTIHGVDILVLKTKSFK